MDLVKSWMQKESVHPSTEVSQTHVLSSLLNNATLGQVTE
jgi:hypothetical protein